MDRNLSFALVKTYLQKEAHENHGGQIPWRCMDVCPRPGVSGDRCRSALFPSPSKRSCPERGNRQSADMALFYLPHCWRQNLNLPGLLPASNEGGQGPLTRLFLSDSRLLWICHFAQGHLTACQRLGQNFTREEAPLAQISIISSLLSQVSPESHALRETE